jgi:hypothetical protein
MLTKSSQSGWILWTQPEVTRLPDFVNITGFCHLLSTPLRQISAKPAHLKFSSSPINNNVICFASQPHGADQAPAGLLLFLLRSMWRIP